MKINYKVILIILSISLTLFSFNSFAAQSPAAGMSFHANPIKCVDGFKQTTYKKAPNGMVTNMVCKTPVISCPENTAPGFIMISEPELKNLGGADSANRFRFKYTCKYFKPAG